METFPISDLETIIALFGAVVLGSIIGTQRNLAGKTAGMRTYALVAMGSALFIVVGRIVTERFIGIANFDPLRIAAQIIAGIGFLGGGMIIFHDSKLTGLTTSAGLWVAAGVGMAMGFSLYLVAVVGTLLTLFVFSILWYVEQYFDHLKK
jgi:putative Mg2+ transporter-C (MgtC) family protein